VAKARFCYRVAVRVSTVRLWITAGFGILVIELALLIFLLVNTTSEIASLRRTTQELKQENEKQERKLWTLTSELEQRRRGRPDQAEVRPLPPVEARTLTPPDLVREYRQAILFDNRVEAESIARSLRVLGGQAVPAIREALRSEPLVDVQRALARILGEIPDREALEFLEEELQKATDKGLRMDLLEGVAKQPGTPRLHLLSAPLMPERDPEVLHSFVKAICKANSEEAISTLIRKVRLLSESEATAFLMPPSEFKHPTLKTFYERLLNESMSEAVRMSCVKALAEVGDASSVSLLESIQNNDTSTDIRREAEQAIAKLKR